MELEVPSSETSVPDTEGGGLSSTTLEPEPPTGPAPRHRAGSRSLLVCAWLTSFGILGALGWAGVVYRPVIVQAWPPSGRIYDAVGLDTRSPAQNHGPAPEHPQAPAHSPAPDHPPAPGHSPAPDHR